MTDSVAKDQAQALTCNWCGASIPSPTPSGAIAPYMFTGGFLRDRRLYACSDECCDALMADFPARRREGR